MEVQRLDTARPYAIVYGHKYIRYEQDGIPYDAEGIQVLNRKAVILSKARQPYKTVYVAEKVIKDRGYDPNRYKVIVFKGGYAIYDTQK